MKITLITGAANGLGKEFAGLYAKDGNNLLLVDIDQTAILSTVSLLKEKYPKIIIDYLIIDLSRMDNLEYVYQYTIKKNYFVNNLVNAAGFGDCKDFKDMDINLQIKMTNVDCNAVLYFTKMFSLQMLEHNEGHIINVASIAAFMPAPYMCTYHACKSYVLFLGEAIAYEFRKTQVKVLTLCPGPFISKFVDVAHNDYTFKKIKPVSSLKVAEFGYKKSLKGKHLAIVGIKNRLTIFLTRFFPRRFVTAMTAKNMKGNSLK